MKGFTRVCLIICLCLALLGAVFCVVGAGMGFGLYQFWQMAEEGRFNIGWGTGDFWFDEEAVETVENVTHWFGGGRSKKVLANSDDDWTQAQERWDADQIRKLDLEFDFGNLMIVPADGNEIEMEVRYRSEWEKYHRSISWKQEDETLMIEDKVDRKIFRLFHHGKDDAELILRIPRDKEFDELKLEIGVAEAEVSLDACLSAVEMKLSIGAGELLGSAREGIPVLKAQELDLDLGAGSAALSGIEAGSLNAECGAGELDLTRVSAEDIDIDSGVGSVTLEMTGKKEYYNYSIECGIGEVQIGDNCYSGLGTEKWIDNGADWNMDISCGIGQVQVTFAD